MTQHPQLLAPGRIGSLELRNRMAMCPMGVLLSNEDGSVSDTEVAYFEARARGGVGLVIVGTTCIAHPRGTNHPRMQAVSDDRFLPGLRRLTAAVHAQGAKIAAQLNHMGFYSFQDILEGRQRLVPFEPAPMRPEPLSYLAPPADLAAMGEPFMAPGSDPSFRVADEDDIAWVIEQYAAAADRCRRAGYDGLELHAGHGYLIDQFLSPRNTRTDGWGGDVEGRARLLLEVVAAIRARVGDDFPLWIRINAREYHREVGETFEDQCRVMELARDAGVDAIHLTAYANTDVATAATDSYAPHRVAELPGFAARVRERVGLPVIAFGRVEVDEAEALLRDGAADVVAFGRRLLADPDLPAKIAAGTPEAVRPCAYQYRCIGNIGLRRSVACTINADLGHEHDPLPAAGGPGRTLVVGGGPAGLETARLLAAAGADVVVAERSDTLGGTLRTAARVDPLLGGYLEWLLREVTEAGVEVRTGAEVDLSTVTDVDHVVVATGASWSPGPTAPPGALGVPDLADWIVEDDTTVGDRVAVLGQGKAALSLALLCVDRGRSTTLVSPEPFVAPELGLPGRVQLVQDLLDGGGTLLTSTEVAWDPAGLRVTSGASAGSTLEVDTVLAIGPTAGPAPDPAAGGVRVHVVGDAAGPAGLVGATTQARDVVREILAGR